jgi:hypothetical protein
MPNPTPNHQTLDGVVPPARTHREAVALFRRPFGPGAIGFRASGCECDPGEGASQLPGAPGGSRTRAAGSAAGAIAPTTRPVRAAQGCSTEAFEPPAGTCTQRAPTAVRG